MEPSCRSGGTGRRTGLKILRDLYSRTGSIPVFGTIFNIAEWSSWQLVGLITRRSEVQVLPPQPVKLYISWLIGQAVKTPPFHGGNRGSIPLWVTNSRDYSSAGRAPALQAGGHRFEPCRSHQGEKPEEAGVAELADAQDLKSCGSNIVPVRFRSPA